MKLLTERSKLVCSHVGGKTTVGKHTQGWVRLQGAFVAVNQDPAVSTFKGCPLAPPTNKFCMLTLSPATGHSHLLFIDGLPVCLDTITGPTDSTPPGTYSVESPEQWLVSAAR